MEPISATAILHGVTQAISATFMVTNTLIQIASAISEIDRSLQQLQREVNELQETLERMGHDFSGPVGSRLLQTNTKSMGNHWRAVVKVIERTNRTLSEMESYLRNVPHADGGNWSRPLRATWLRFKESDIAYYRSDIDRLTRNMQFELTMVLVCRDMNGMSNSGAQGFEVNLTSTEDRWRQLKKDAIKVQSSPMGRNQSNPYRRNEVRNSSASTLVPNETFDWDTGNQYLRQRQRETAKEVDDFLTTASELLSTASTVCAQPYRGSFDDIGQSPQRRAEIMQYIVSSDTVFNDVPTDRIEDGPPPAKNKKSENACLAATLLLPRGLAVLTLLAGFLCFYGLLMVYMPLWAFGQLFMCFKHGGSHWKSLVNGIGTVNRSFGKSWKWVLRSR